MTQRGSRRGTVLMVANFAPDVGFAWWLMENFWIELATLARSVGFDPLLVYPEDSPLPESIRSAQIETLTLPFPGPNLASLTRSIGLVRSRRVRCIYFTDRNFASITYLLFRMAGVRQILNHDHTPGDRPPIGGLKGAAKATWIRFGPISCDLQICCSPLLRERAITNGRIPAAKTTIIRNGIVPIECSGDRGYASRALGVTVNSLVCMSVGRANPYKRIDFAIEVARRCVFELNLRNLIFIHCGDGPDIERLKNLVSKAGLRGHFILAGRRSDVKQLLCSADLAIHPAKGEAFSLAILEYMSAGLAVLVPDVPTVRQAIRHGDTGLVYPDGDADAAAKLLAQLASDPVYRSRLGAAAAAEVREGYSLQRTNQSFRALMSEVLSRI